MNVLKIVGVNKNFGGVKALSNINLAIGMGTITSIIGPNGAGKTTLFNTISGFHTADSGKIYLLEDDITKFSPEKVASKKIARTFQNIRLFAELTIVENVLIGMHLQLKSGVKDILLNTARFKNEEVNAYLKALEIIDYIGLKGLEEEKAKNLSYGNQRKLEIGRALALEPILIMLDEPAAGLNNRETEEMKNFIAKIRKEKNCSVLLIEHDMKLVMGISDRIAVLNYGKLIAEGNPGEVSNDKHVINAYLGEPDDEYDNNFIA